MLFGHSTSDAVTTNARPRTRSHEVVDYPGQDYSTSSAGPIRESLPRIPYWANTTRIPLRSCTRATGRGHISAPGAGASKIKATRTR